MVISVSQRSIRQRSVSELVSGLASSKNGNVLVVASRLADAESVSELLIRAGYRPQWCSDPARIVSAVPNGHDDYIATVLCHRVRPSSPGLAGETADLPLELPGKLQGRRIIALSDCVAEDTVVSLLKAGAHHCFNLHEAPRVLQVRLEAALRRHGLIADRLLIQGDIRFDLLKRRVTLAGKRVDLSPKEYELACYLFSNRGRVVANSELMTSIWSLPPGMDTRRIDTAACRVRKKLKLDPTHGWELKRLRRIGYRLVRVEVELSDAPTHGGKGLEPVVA